MFAFHNTGAEFLLPANLFIQQDLRCILNLAGCRLRKRQEITRCYDDKCSGILDDTGQFLGTQQEIQGKDDVAGPQYTPEGHDKSGGIRQEYGNRTAVVRSHLLNHRCHYAGSSGDFRKTDASFRVKQAGPVLRSLTGIQKCLHEIHAGIVVLGGGGILMFFRRFNLYMIRFLSRQSYIKKQMIGIPWWLNYGFLNPRRLFNRLRLRALNRLFAGTLILLRVSISIFLLRIPHALTCPKLLYMKISDMNILIVKSRLFCQHFKRNISVTGLGA